MCVQRGGNRRLFPTMAPLGDVVLVRTNKDLLRFTQGVQFQHRLQDTASKILSRVPVKVRPLHIERCNRCSTDNRGRKNLRPFTVNFLLSLSSYVSCVSRRAGRSRVVNSLSVPIHRKWNCPRRRRSNSPRVKTPRGRYRANRHRQRVASRVNFRSVPHLSGGSVVKYRYGDRHPNGHRPPICSRSTRRRMRARRSSGCRDHVAVSRLFRPAVRGQVEERAQYNLPVSYRVQRPSRRHVQPSARLAQLYHLNMLVRLT